MATEKEVNQYFDSLLWGDMRTGTSFPEVRPLLAHYTSISTLECIMKNEEIWLSNPLFMNDTEEMRFGMVESARAFRESEEVRDACGTSERYQRLLEIFESRYAQFEADHAFDTYILCFSEHDEVEHADGLLSMWRGYGGNGNGAAIVFDTRKLENLEASPLILSKVLYASRATRLRWIADKLIEFAEAFSKAMLPLEQFYLAVHSLFERFKLFALLTKHDGFREEREWRIVYLCDRDRDSRMSDMLGYSVGRQGIEPKLKLKIKPIEGATADDLSLEKLVHKIILGPSLSNALSVMAMQRMLETVGHGEIAKKLLTSTTPYRSS